MENIKNLAKKLDQELLKDILLIDDAMKFLKKIERESFVKLTQKGNLPRKFCREFAAEAFTKDEDIALLKKEPIMGEEDCKYILLLNNLTGASGFTKKIHGKRFLTKKGQKVLTSNDRYQVFKEMFQTYILKLNWSYFDIFPECLSFRTNIEGTLLLLYQFGDEFKNVQFHLDRYIEICPECKNDFSDTPYMSRDKMLNLTYINRVLFNFLRLFGLVEFENCEKELSDILIKRTILFENFIVSPI